MGIPVVAGPAIWAKVLGCPSPCDCDVVIHENDRDKIDSPCVWTIREVEFVHRHVWLMGFPVISLDFLEKLSGDTVECILERLRVAISNAPQ